MIKELLKLNIGKYFIISCLASVIDFAISYLLYDVTNLNYLLACNVGIVSGFIFQCVTCMKYIFDSKNLSSSLLIYVATFALGIAVADATMWLSFDISHLSFLISKFFSMAIPFFVTYFIRRKLLGVKNNKEK
ncbi:GtrA family protein [Clostridium aciditolerans]|uniref:GtrA family protein n=1 Tax=Clostridium aciditolerans TaxID=339861 RepID=A0A934M0E5_9CLOT|nr:GtrA family protein [Clostridium aciditolerans]MBI6872054.1 GtrA family protein [Clostridium aciditolerans]